MFIHKLNPWKPRGGEETPRDVAFSRRRWLKRAGWLGGAVAAGGLGAWAWQRVSQGTDEQVIRNGRTRDPVTEQLPGTRDTRFEYGRPETERIAAARYTNFYEFSRFKWCWRYVEPFQVSPWTVTIDGLCRKPMRLDIESLVKRFGQHVQERQYRHRCVERWAMAIPWNGIPLSTVLRAADPQASATHVRFVSFDRPEQAANQIPGDEYPWPYTEGLTLSEAMLDLSFLAVGMYGEPLLKQHGAPIRLVVPWKYGYKSIKSITHIELIDHQPDTFWSTLAPSRYPFESNVDPDVPRPWDQSMERMLGTDEMFPTKRYNGYEQWAGPLYKV